MIVPIRKTIVGTEYWDIEKKQSLLIPKGSEPDFEVTENPKSMITPEGDKVEVINANHIVSEAINLEAFDSNSNAEADLVDEVNTNSEDDQPSDLNNMTAKELRAYAKKNDIRIPAAIRAKGDILQIIQELE
ncbi:hypothetical protein IGJ28_000293 [Enterococcus sp. AZ091]|uniref:hypothetical protein n=1 Tax=Enterococcus TaxID=1350 RepID=UPI00209044D2|nr:hypothetical protein [Enterococcus gallinarum]MCO5478226.1 hypothetical protein [Enterococcus gallinarum]